jgi:hypothetical protein
MEEMRAISWPHNIKERDHLGDLDVDGRIMLKLILGKYGVRIC